MCTSVFQDEWLREQIGFRPKEHRIWSIVGFRSDLAPRTRTELLHSLGPARVSLLEGRIFLVCPTVEQLTALVAAPGLAFVHAADVNLGFRRPNFAETDHRVIRDPEEIRAEIRAKHAAGILGQGVRIGHLDTGVDASALPEGLKVAAWKAFDEGAREIDSAPNDPFGHGTATACAILEVAPKVELHCAQVLEHGLVLARVLCGLEWMLTQPVDIVCMALGLPFYTPLFDAHIEALSAQGKQVVAPSGNAGPGVVHSPAFHPLATTVGALDSHGKAQLRCSTFRSPLRNADKPDRWSLASVSSKDVSGGSSLATAIYSGEMALDLGTAQ